MVNGRAIAFLLAVLLAAPASAICGDRAPAEEKLVEHPRFSIEVPPIVLTDVPVRRIVIRAYNAQPLISGIRLALPQSDDAKLGPFHNGVLELTTDQHEGRKIYISAPEIVVDGG